KLNQGFRISGRLLGPDGPVHDLGVRLLSPGSEAFETDRGFEAAVTVSDANGAFTFLGVLPGTYRLRVNRMPIAPIPGQPAAPVLRAEQSLSVNSDDISDLTVSVRPGLKVSGRVQFSGSKPPPQTLAQIGVGLRAVGAGVMDRASMTWTSPQGTFTTNGDMPG